MASTGTGSRGRKPTSQLKGAVTMPHATISSNTRTVTSLFSRKNLIMELSIFHSIVLKIFLGGNKYHLMAMDFHNLINNKTNERPKLGMTERAQECHVQLWGECMSCNYNFLKEGG